jgi:Arrestin (or S-antigen), N-terminal domain
MINFPGFGGGGSSEIMLLNLEKSQYDNGEKVKGYLTITSNKDVDSHAFRFIVEGKEETKITVSEPYSSSSNSNYSNEYRNVTYTSSNVFFFQDLLEFLKGNSLIDIEKVRNDKETVIRKGKTEIPFEFIIPNNTLSSYSGKNAWITYSVKTTIDKKMRIDVNSSINFDVIFQYDNSNISSRPISVSTFKANDLELKLDLDKSVYNVGDTIRGTINVKKLNPDIDIRGTEILLISIEKAIASNRTVETKIYENKYKITDWKEKQNCPFQMDIPQMVTRSYRGRYSEIVWEIKAKVDLPLSQDLNAEAIIEII